MSDIWITSGGCTLYLNKCKTITFIEIESAASTGYPYVTHYMLFWQLSCICGSAVTQKLFLRMFTDQSYKMLQKRLKRNPVTKRKIIISGIHRDTLYVSFQDWEMLQMNAPYPAETRDRSVSLWRWIVIHTLLMSFSVHLGLAQAFLQMCTQRS